MRRAIPLLALLLLVPVATAHEEHLAAALKNPPATGILVTQVVPGSQAEEQGIDLGDVFISYGGHATPDVAALNLAKEKCAEAETVDAVVVGVEGERKITLAPGQIGFNGIAVTKGEAVPDLPPATDITFDFTSLASTPLESWEAFSLGGPEKAGFEHTHLSLEDGKLTLRSEVAFDGGEMWGLNHFDVTIVMKAGKTPTFVRSSFVNPLTEWEGVCELDEGGATWTVTWPDEEPRQVKMPEDLPLIPAYFVQTLAGFMPREEGACIRFRGLNEGMGSAGLPAALVCVGEEWLEHGVGKVKTWRYEQRMLGGGASSTFWVDEQRTCVRVDWGGAYGTRSTKVEALKDLNPELKPRTAD